MSSAPHGSCKESNRKPVGAVARSLPGADGPPSMGISPMLLAGCRRSRRPAKSSPRLGITRGWWRSAAIGQGLRFVHPGSRPPRIIPDCPRCGLSIGPKVHTLTIEYCPPVHGPRANPGQVVVLLRAANNRAVLRPLTASRSVPHHHDPSDRLEVGRAECRDANGWAMIHPGYMLPREFQNLLVE